MQRIYPVDADQCKGHYGKPVLVILKDGSEIYGTLSKVENGQLVLGSEEVAEAERAGTSKSKRKPGKKRSVVRNTAQTSGFPVAPYPYPVYPFGTGRLVLDLALIALLFVLI